MKDFILFSTLVYGVLLAGWGFRKVAPAFDHNGVSRLVSRISLICIETPSFLIVLWGVNKELFTSNLKLAVFPIILSAVFGGVGFFFSSLLRPNDIRYRGAFTLAAMVSNNGMTLGGFLCLLFLGETGLRLSQIYTLFLLPYVVFALFPLAKTIGRRARIREGVGHEEKKAIFLDPSIILPLTSIITGLSLNLSGVPFPALLDRVLPFLVMTSVAGYSVSFGLGLQFSSFHAYWKACVAMLPIKFVIGPLLGVFLAFLFGFSPGGTPTAFRVILIQASMPSAIMSVVMAKIYDLDDHLAVNVWLFTTLCTAAMFPLLRWISLS
jgi:predicted permease